MKKKKFYDISKIEHLINKDITFNIKKQQTARKEEEKLKNSEDILNFIKFKYFSEIGKNAESSINDYLRWK